MKFKWSKINAVALMLLMLFFVGNSQVFAQQLADPQDRISVSMPLPNRYVSGSVTTSFRLADDDQASIPFEVTLRNNTCTGVIANINSGNVQSGTDRQLNWNSEGPVGGVASISDGKYCLEVCGSFRNGNIPYSACNSRYVLIRNHNSNPVITTNVPADREIFRDESWRYDVNARDAEGDRLTFSLAQSPSFLSINRFTGLVYTNARAKSVGTYTVKVKVTDGFGGRDTQTFNITIRNRPQQSSSSSQTSSATSSTSSATSSSSSSESPNLDDVEITFVSPQAGDVFAGDENAVAWEVTGYEPTADDEILVNLLIAGEDALQVAELNGDVTTYNLDVSSLEAGEYRMEVILNVGEETIAQQSDLFTIQEGEDPGENVNRPLITNVKPVDGAELVDEPRPEISGEFVSPPDSEIDVSSFKLLLDNTERDWCDEVTQSGFKCVPDIDLSPGLHKLRVVITDTQNRSTPLEWTFNLELTDVPTDVDPDGGFVIFGRVLDFSGLIILVVLCVVLLMLFGVPWILFLIWRRRQNQTETTTDEYNINNYYPQDDVATTYDDAASNTPSTEYVSTPDYGLGDIDLGTGSDTGDTNIQSSPAINVPVIVNPTPEPTTAPAPVSSPTASSGDQNGGEIDPLQFDSYEDYLAAVSAQTNAGSGSGDNTADAASTDAAASTPDTTDPNYISAPDYSDLYTASPDTGSQVEDNNDSGNDDSGSPDWLNPV